jgi:hypothetical protein
VEEQWCESAWAVEQSATLLITAATMTRGTLSSQAVMSVMSVPDLNASSWRAFGRNPIA